LLDQLHHVRIVQAVTAGPTLVDECGLLHEGDVDGAVVWRRTLEAIDDLTSGPAMRGRPVCRLDGGEGGGPKGERNGAYRTGRYTAEAKAERRKQRALIRELRRPDQLISLPIPAVIGIAAYYVLAGRNR
jgi:hypothetical protein